ncbi:MAG: DUF3482 domain-containing protein, partial [Gammaproteobacteria bacterium]|nr:DUF3482 domain-containing protein [Gammaproteobacteria bacterium]
ERVEAIYAHQGLSRVEDRDSLLASDVFSSQSWQAFGLSRRELMAAGAASGAVAGGGVDLALGGASMLLGAGLGAVIGGAGALFGARRLARVQVLGTPLAGRRLTVGPIRDPGFAWVVLGRACLHQRLVSERNHARRGALIVDYAHSQTSWPPQQRRALERAIAPLRDPSGPNAEQRQALIEAIEPALAP